ncbi:MULTISPECIES: murein hydrolase activator EnvC family protein [Pedobacter]|uniref:Peptidase M23 n=1 Tax=Pedobacter heparinus (strain ATCC 13125 / DSM 2366 / CIP 104194 / JCM 7457 / NBRC 12017 / NCIMB 9290 / NRRL B-14731 / HIM 762-3) TaxID=485917 RepID=C6XV21_PEDHD|nr:MULTISPECIES: peptidoglycan DD-metalloendopeptidase family protein [Pedobacter]ACU06029.1 Peptidase M23 [Pedobacter heparinus DSM 2366]MBB5438789.1 septal ring factor EnvC (AmiA/AmiB activator) [Pedobacter sp. AK017]
MKLNKSLLLLLFIFSVSLVRAQSSSELKRKKEAIQREIELLQRNLNKTANNKKLTLGQINALNTKIKLMQDKITVINSEIKNLDNQIHENTNTVITLKGQLNQLKKEYAAMIRFAQRNKNAYDKMMFIFAAKDFNQAYKRIKYLQQFGQYRKKQAGYIQGTQKDLNYKIVVLDKNLKEKSSLLHEQENEKDKLGKNKSQQSAVLSKYSKQEKQYRQDIATRKKQQAQLDRSIRAAIAREIALERKRAEEAARAAAAKAAAAAAAKARAENRPVPAAPVAKPKESSGGYMAATPEAARLSAAFESNRGSLPWPVAAGSITESFGKHKEGQASYDNAGVTIQTAEGAGVRAVFNGKVTKVGNALGRYYILIKHGQFFTVYQNLRSVSVSAGDDVTTKQNIGTVASSGDVPELQFQIYRGTAAQNPAAWIAK